MNILVLNGSPRPKGNTKQNDMHEMYALLKKA